MLPYDRRRAEARLSKTKLHQSGRRKAAAFFSFNIRSAFPEQATAASGHIP